jgi:2-polyprenyl-3-methyl-5-hydroxy-6-metoxy-1,4-benzoquinol methylase
MNLLNLARRKVSYPTRINVGCGYDKRPGYLNVDMDPACSPDLLLKDNDFSKLPQGFFEEVLAMDVLEHIPRVHTIDALMSWASLLKPDGLLTFQTSSIEGIIDQMRANDNFEFQYNWTALMFGNQAHPGDFHFNGFTDKTLRISLAAAGFLVEHFDIKDGWLFSASAQKNRDWKAPAETYQHLTITDFVTAVYRDVLFRDVDDHARKHWNHELGVKRISRLEMLRRITSSPEHLYKLANKMKL